MEELYKSILGGRGQIYYITKFDQFDNGAKASWNWPAFFFTGIWALYRKMYRWFFAFWGVAFFASIIDKSISSSGIGVFFYLVSMGLYGIYANYHYHQNIKKKIAVAQQAIKDEVKLISYLGYKGGVNSWVPWVFGALPVIAILIPIIQNIIKN